MIRRLTSAVCLCVLGIGPLSSDHVRAEPPDAQLPPAESTRGLTNDTGAPAGPSAPDEIDSQSSEITAAHAALDQGDGQKALDLLRDRLIHLPTAERLSVEGRAWLLLGDTSAARRKLKSALALRPACAVDRYWLGRTYAATGSPTLAVAEYRKAHWNGLETVELHYHWAAALRDSGILFGRLTQHPWPADAEAPPAPGLFAFDGLVLNALGSTSPSGPVAVVSPRDSAIFQVYQALAIDPRHGPSLLLCAESWAALDRHEPAVGFFERAARQLQDKELARCNTGWADSLLALGDVDGYLEHSRLSLKSNGVIDSARLADCYQTAAKHWAGRGLLPRQIRCLTFAAELDPAADRLIALADALLQAHRPSDAADYLELALTQNPTVEQQRLIHAKQAHVAFLSPAASSDPSTNR